MQFEHVLATVAGFPWAIEPEMGQRIAAILTNRIAGHKPSAETLAEVVAVRHEREHRRSKSQPRGVSVIPIHGVMVPRADLFMQVSGVLSTQQVGQLVDDAANDASVEAIVLDIDSPGGAVPGTHELAGKINGAKKKKKVICVANAAAASAAFWVGTQGTEFVVTPSGQVGSLGVFSMHIDQSEALKSEGVKVTFVSSTPEKVAGNEFEPLSDIGRNQKQSTVDGYYRHFLSAVAAGRKTSVANVQETFGKGGMVLADEAVRRGMVDRVASLDDVLSQWGLSSADLSPPAFDSAMMSAKAFDPELEVRRRKLRLS